MESEREIKERLTGLTGIELDIHLLKGDNEDLWELELENNKQIEIFKKNFGDLSAVSDLNSRKSSTLALKIVELIKENKRLNQVVRRLVCYSTIPGKHDVIEELDYAFSQMKI